MFFFVLSLFNNVWNDMDRKINCFYCIMTNRTKNTICINNVSYRLINNCNFLRLYMNDWKKLRKSNDH